MDYDTIKKQLREQFKRCEKTTEERKADDLRNLAQAKQRQNQLD